MATWTDSVGNVHGRLSSYNETAETLVIGSHYDTVIDAGIYDGALGIIAGIAAIKTLLVGQLISAVSVISIPEETDVIDVGQFMPEEGRWDKLRYHVEVIAFSDEEGVRYQTTFLGSKAVAGTLVESGMLHALDADGVTLADALQMRGHDNSPQAVSSIALAAENVRGYVEVHLEQGPFLESSNQPLGVVSGIAGQARLLVQIFGEQGHAGTVPMLLRKDALAAAADIIVQLEALCGGGHNPRKQLDNRAYLVCTVGKLTQWPGASNVIAGSANVTVDIRSDDDDLRRDITSQFRDIVMRVCLRRGVTCTDSIMHEANAVLSDPSITMELKHAVASVLKSSTVAKLTSEASTASACDALGHDCHADTCKLAGCQERHDGSAAMVSGAGHDALAIANITRIGMLFVRCRQGISHSPLEFVSEADITASVLALYSYVANDVLHSLV